MKNMITRHGTFDAGHRVLHHAESLNKCRNVHGHLYKVNATFTYDEEEDIGYKVDFAEIKRIFFGFVDEYLDHGFIANPQDHSLIKLLRDEKNKVYLMNLGEDCNPSAENIAKELFFMGNTLMERYGLQMAQIELFETPNCSVRCVHLKPLEINYFKKSALSQTLKEFLTRFEVKEYDQRKLDVSKNQGVSGEEDAKSNSPHTIRTFINPKAEKTIP